MLVLPVSVSAQTVGATIRGVVTEKSGAPIDGVQITLVNEETREKRQILSGADGLYALAVLPPGTYRLEGESTGFRKYVRKALILRVGQEIRNDITLEPGPPGEEVVVTALQTLVKLDSPSVGFVLENQQITGLPLDGRNFLQLSLLVPGTAPSAPGSPGSVRGEFTINVN